MTHIPHDFFTEYYTTCSDEYYLQHLPALTHKHLHDSARIRHDRRRQEAEAFSHLLRLSLSRLHNAAACEWAAPLITPRVAAVMIGQNVENLLMGNR